MTSPVTASGAAAEAAHVSPARRLIDETCRRFLQTCGWPLRFRPVVSSEAPPDEGDLLWRRELTDGRGCIGELILDLPDDESLDAEFLQMTKAAELVAELLDEAISAHTDAATSRNELETLARIGSQLPKQPDLPSALGQLLRAVTQLTGFRTAAFFLLDPKADRLALRLKYDVYETRMPAARRELTPDCPDLAALAGRPPQVRRSTHAAVIPWLPPNMSTAVCVPVRSEAAPIGTLWAFDRRDRPIEPREMHVVESIAAQLAAVLERAVLVRESASEKKLRRHLRAASEGQPGQELTSPGPDCGFESAGVCKSAFEIGGDLVELIPLSPTRTLLAIGDASGDGPPAAMVMAAVRGAVRALASADPGDAIPDLMARVNRALHGITPPHQFMSLLLGVFDADARTFAYTNAGHPAPLHVRGGRFAELESHGMLVGVTDDSEYERSVIAVEADDLFVFFSDGVSEAMGRDSRMFRSDGISGAVRSALDRPPAEVVEAIWSRLVLHQQGGGHADDRSLLVLRAR